MDLHDGLDHICPEHSAQRSSLLTTCPAEAWLMVASCRASADVRCL